MHDFGHGTFQQFRTHQQDNHGHKQSGYIFDSAMAEGMTGVRLLAGHPETYKSNDGGTCIREVVESVCSNGNGIADSSGDKFPGEETEIQENAHSAAQNAVCLPNGRVLSIDSVFNENVGQ